MALVDEQDHLLGEAQDRDEPEKEANWQAMAVPPAWTSTTSPRLVVFLAIVAMLSSLSNLLWVYQNFHWSNKPSFEDRSLYAQLSREVSMPFGGDSLFSPRNRTLSDMAWDNWAVDPGIVALPHDWVKAKMLPRAQRWPWDGDKGVYLLNGYHNLHCLQLIRKSLIDAAEGRPFVGQNRDADAALEHNLHCIESLREDTLCNADDTPRYSGYSKHEIAGVLQNRMCRDWNQLEAWARRHTACYRDIGRDVKGFPQIEKYKFCPEGYIFRSTGSAIPPWDTGSGIHRPGEE